TNESLADVLYAANGIAVFPAAAAPANNVSLAEVVRAVYDAVAADGTATTTVQAGFGRRVTKVNASVATSTDALFVVTGKCLITLIVGEVTSVFATTTSMQLTTSTGTVALCAATDVVTEINGTLYILSGDPDDALNGGQAENPNLGALKTGTISPFLMNDNGINQTITSEGTGLVQWDLWYIPLEASASIASAA
ncbi:MAG: hypothetical protein NUV72_02300, partial [Bauldia sp.]|nr:hypothetical protein [Bauldia sp.]